MSRKHVVITMATAAVGLVTLSACTSAPQAPTDSYAPPTNVAAAADVQQVADVTLSAVEVDGLGQILTDQDGYTLYRFTMDSAQPPTSTCDTACAAKWPPLTSEVDIEVSGVDRSLIGTVTRDDGANQVTVNGWPVYKFTGDVAPGEVNGQGVHGTWFAVTPDGGKAGAQPEQSGPVQIVAADLPGFGPALTDQDGRTLYLFTKDTKAPSKSVCDGACAELWPPVPDDGDVQVTGVDKAIVGSVTRADGTEQVTVGGWPVYRYANDTDAGQTNGHGVAGTWFVIEPAGCKSAAPIQPPAQPQEAPADPAPDTGY